MTHSNDFSNAKETLYLPFLSGFYNRVAQPLAWTALRIAVGGALAVAAWDRVGAPFVQVKFVESLGFYPGWFWSPLLVYLQFFGGIAILLGLFTRPVALANLVMLLITYWYHLKFPYGDIFLTPAGLNALTEHGTQFLTANGVRRLSDGGVAFLATVQTKAELASLFWAGGAGLFAAFGGGYWSVDRCFLRKEF